MLSTLSKPHKLPNLSLFLANIYAWRSDLRDYIPKLSQEEVSKLIQWWIQWGMQNYNNISLDVILTPELISEEESNSPPLFKTLLFGQSSLNSEEKLVVYFRDWFPFLIEKNSKIVDLLLVWLKENPDFILTNDCTTELNRKKLAFNNKRKKIVNDVVIFGVPGLKIGIGEDARLLSLALTEANIKHCYDSATTISNKLNIFALPAPDILIKLAEFHKNDEEIFVNSYRIASCPWELPIWPETLLFIFDIFNEVWVHSDFVLNSIPKKFHHKVFKYPQPVIIHSNNGIKRENSKINTKLFNVLISFDFSSHITRKNPEAAINAFKAFSIGKEDVGLIIKTNNSKEKKLDYAIFENLTKDIKNLILIEETLDHAALHQLYSQADCFLSLHRSEGFGRNIAEFMLLGIPCVTTAFSGNLDFCNNESAFLVGFSKIPLERNDYIFSENQFWADPNVEEAIKHLESIYKSEPEVNKKTKSAKEAIETSFSISSTSNFLKVKLSNFCS